MATKTKNTPKVQPKAETLKKEEENIHLQFAFGKINYILMLVGIGLIILGFIFMTGGGSTDPKVFNESMFDFRRLTLSTILVLAGFVVEIFAIVKKAKD